MGERAGVYRVLDERPQGKRPLGRLRGRWEDESSGCGIVGHGLD